MFTSIVHPTNSNRLWGLFWALPLILAVLALALAFPSPAYAYNCSNGTVIAEPAGNPGLVGDCNTLMGLKSTLVGSATTVNWSTDAAISTWTGITLEGNPSRVTKVLLPNKSLNGSMQGGFGSLTKLTDLDLGDNTLAGGIPSGMGDSSTLVTIEIDNNNLTGTISGDIGNISSLVTLNLQDNRLSGSIPSGLGSLTVLESLLLQDNKLTGSLPTALGSMTNLETMDLSSNSLSGSIPTQLGNLSNLEFLYLDDNALTGSIPTQLGSATALTKLYLNDNELTGSIPTGLGSLTSLTHLYLSNNELTGALPSTLTNLSNLTHLYLNYNNLSGSLTAPLTGMTSLQNMVLNNNKFTTLANAYTAKSNLKQIHLHHNNFPLNWHPKVTVGYADSLSLDFNEDWASNSHRSFAEILLSVPQSHYCQVPTNYADNDHFHIHGSWCDLMWDYSTFPVDYENPTDSDTDNLYVTRVNQKPNNQPATKFLYVYVYVKDVIDTPTVKAGSEWYPYDSQELTLTENSTSNIYDYSTAEFPANATITWSVIGDDSALFQVDSSGVLTFRNAPNYESPSDTDTDNEYHVSVHASDGTDSDSLDVVIEVTDVDEPPDIVGADLTINENSAGTQATFTASDQEGETNLTWSLSGDDSSLFALSTGGALSFISAPDYEDPQDGNAASGTRDNNYEITVRVTDQTSNTGTLGVTVTVNDIDEPPVLTGLTTVTYAENGSVSAATYTATDPEGQNIAWTLSGDDSDLFTLTAGSLAFKSPPDFEDKRDADTDNQYKVTITASDSTVSSSVNVTINVTNVDESPSISGNASVSYAENSSAAAATYTATDPEGEATITWSIGGDDATFFTISSAGVLSFSTSPNYENKQDLDSTNVYLVTVQATDPTANQGTLSVAVTVTDLNEQHTVAGLTAYTYPENGTTGIGLFSASDPENAGGFTWSLTGTDSGDLSINSAGILSFPAPPNYEGPTDNGENNSYNVNVVAADSSFTASLAVTVTVTDANDAPVATDFAVSTDEDTQAQINILGGDHATDEDSGDTLEITITVAPVASAGVATVNDDDTVTFTPTANWYGTASFTYQVSDGTASDTGTVSLTVNSVNDTPTVVSQVGAQTLNASETSKTIDLSNKFDDVESPNTLTFSATSQDTTVVTVSIEGNDSNQLKLTKVGEGSTTVTATATDPGSAAANQTIQVTVDTTAPTPTITGPTSPQNAAFTVTINFDEPVTGFTQEDLTVGNGSASLFQETVFQQTYTAKVTPTAEGTVTVDVAANAVDDLPGNASSAADQYSGTYDTTSPGPTISSTASAPVGGAFAVSIAFDEAVTGFMVTDLTIGNGTATGLTANGNTYSTTISPTVATGTITIDLAAGKLTDLAGNSNTAATQFSITANVTVPTVGISGPAGPISAPFTANFAFSEDVVNFSGTDITVGNGTADNFNTGSAKSYSATITPTADFNGSITIDVAAGSAQDGSNNGNTAAAQYQVTVDQNAPILTFTAPATTQTGGFTLTIAFDETVTGFDESDLTVSDNAAKSSFQATTPGTAYSVVITPNAGIQAAVTVHVATSAAQDLAGNNLTAAVQASVDVDNLPPTVSITGPATPQKGAFSITIKFSETVTGFDGNDLKLTNATAGALSQNGATFTTTLTPASGYNGDVTIDIAAEAVQDAQGHHNAAATPLNVLVDQAIPTVRLTTAAEQPVRGPFTATISFSEDVNDLELSDLVVTNGAASVLTTTTQDSVFTVMVTPTEHLFGQVTIDLAADQVVDEAGNGNSSANQLVVQADLQNIISWKSHVYEGYEGGPAITVAVNVAPASSASLDIPITLVPGSTNPAETADYAAAGLASGNLTISAGNRSASFTITFPQESDGTDLEDETLQLGFGSTLPLNVRTGAPCIRNSPDIRPQPSCPGCSHDSSKGNGDAGGRHQRHHSRRHIKGRFLPGLQPRHTLPGEGGFNSCKLRFTGGERDDTPLRQFDHIRHAG